MSRSSDTRARILDAAAEHFMAKGYQRTSLEAIAASAGVTKATVLYHFESKDRLVAEMLEPLVADLEQVVTEAEAQPPHRRAWTLIEGWLDAMLGHRSYMGVFVHEYARLGSRMEIGRLLELYFRAYDLVSGPGAGLRERVRASQLLALVSDPVVHNRDADVAVLREIILDGVRQFLGARPAGRAPRPSAPDVRSDVPRPEVPPHDVPLPRRRRGRPVALSAEQARAAAELHRAGSHTVDEIAARFGVSRTTLYRHLRQAGS